MRQLLLLILLFFAGQWLFKTLKRANSTPGAPGGGAQPGARAGRGGATQAPALPDPLVRCAECGVHTPTSEAVVLAGDRFCCADHARRHSARPSGRDAR